MANLKSSKKKARKDIRKSRENSSYRGRISQVLRLAQNKSLEAKGFDVKMAYAIFDKSAKRGIISKKRAARLKSRISSLR